MNRKITGIFMEDQRDMTFRESNVRKHVYHSIVSSLTHASIQVNNCADVVNIDLDVIEFLS